MFFIPHWLWSRSSWWTHFLIVNSILLNNELVHFSCFGWSNPPYVSFRSVTERLNVTVAWITLYNDLQFGRFQNLSCEVCWFGADQGWTGKLFSWGRARPKIYGICHYWHCWWQCKKFQFIIFLKKLFKSSSLALLVAV